MNAYLNYILEANLGLIVILACYRLLLSRETSFQLIRALLLTGIFASLIFPLIHIGNAATPSPLSIGTVIPSYWLPEIVVGDQTASVADRVPRQFWTYASLAYWVGITVVALLVSIQLMQLIRIIRRSKTYRLRRLRIVESAEDRPTFSFFNFIFIGNAHELSSTEKQQIIRHESVHALQWHSLDVLLINVLKVIFWFNPLITTYKKIFIQLHEFEADARTVENSDVNKYCSLLARVALKSADLTFANHFHNSLTVKRIEMIRTIKSQIKRWKLAVVAAVLPLIFFFVACHDQIGDDIQQITANSSHTLIVPEQVQKTFERWEAEHPEKKYALLELNETASGKLDDLQSRYGLPTSVTVIKTENGKIVKGGIMRGESESGVLLQKDMLARPNDDQTFVIMEYGQEASRLSNSTSQDGVFTVVEEQPEFPGGFDAMMAFIRNNMQYPLTARQQGIEGTVYVSFIVETNGSVSDVHTIRGISPEADAEAVRVIQLSPNWKPGKQNHQIVRVRFVLPIKFSLGVGAKKRPEVIEERPATD